MQAYEGVVIAKRNRGLNSSFVVRKISSGEGVERTFQTYSPLIASIELKRKGDVRRAKLYYLRARSGKSARIREKLEAKEGKAARLAGARAHRASRDGAGAAGPTRRGPRRSGPVRFGSTGRASCMVALSRRPFCSKIPLS